MMRPDTRWLVSSITLLFLLVFMVLPGTFAQETGTVDVTASPSPTPTNTAAPIVATRFEPTQVNQGQAAILSIFGVNFTSTTTVRLIGFGFLPTTVINSTALSVTLPNSLLAGGYSLEVSDPSGGTVLLPEALTILAPTATPTLTLTPPAYISASRYEPTLITSGQANVLSVYGSNFTQTTTVRLIGFGLLPTTFVNSTTLSVAMPDNMQAGQYSLEVTDPVGGSALLPVPLTVQPAIVPTNTPAPFNPPTPIPGQPSLLARNFSTRPAQSAPGDTITLTFEIVNAGNRMAEGVTISVDSGNFVPAQGSASATLANIPAGGSATVTLSVIAGMETPAGPNSVPISMTYRDLTGEVYTSKTSLSVQIVPLSEASQVVIEEYTVDPDPVMPGQPVTVNVRLTNRGNETASQVLLRVAGAESILLAGARGDSFPAGDLAPGASVDLSLPLVVSMEAEAGPQAQPVTITYLQKGEGKETAASLTVEVEAVTQAEPLLLLESYDTGNDTLLPGEQFTLNLTIKNMGAGQAEELLVVFGTVESQGGSAPPSDGNSGDGGSNTQTSTTPSNTFAPLGTGGSHYVGVLAANGGTIELTQDFIVNGTVTSGVYSLPISLVYRKSDGSSTQNNLRASVVVVVPPRLQMTLQPPLMEMVNVGEPIPIGLNILNMGKNTVNLVSASISGENVEVMADGQNIVLGAVKTEKDTTINGTVMAQAEGAVRIVVTINYLDELNRPQVVEQVYETQAVMPPPPIDMPPMEEMPIPVDEVEEEEDDTLGRILLGLLGLGS